MPIASPAWANAIDAMPDGLFMSALCRSTLANSDCPVATCKAVLVFLGKSLEVGVSDDNLSPIVAYDAYVDYLFAMDRVWPMAVMLLDELPETAKGVVDFDVEATLAEFLLRRLPHAATLKGGWSAPVTKAIAIAELMHDLVTLFAVGCAPTGSKDPYAMRRAGNHLWIALRGIDYEQ